MIEFPKSPHAIIQIERPGTTDGSLRYDSWDTTGLIKEINVELVTNQTSQSRIKLFDPKFRVIDQFANVTQKTAVRVYLGYTPDLGEPIFKGVLGQLERGRDTTTMVVFDSAFVMKLEKKSGYKNKKDDLAIIRELVTKSVTPDGRKLKFEGPTTPLKLEPSKVSAQDAMTDWDYMMERAKDSGLVIFVRGDTVFAKYPAKTEGPVLTLKNGKDFTLLSGWDFTYKTPENQDGKPKVVKHRRRGKGGKRAEGQSDVGATGRTDVVIKHDHSKATKSKLTARAKAKKELEREHAFEGHLETLMPMDGRRLDVRRTVAIEGIGKLFSGKYICNATHYAFRPGKLGINLDLYKDINQKPDGKPA